MNRVHYRAPWLRGLGDAASAICLDQSQNTVPCSDPSCTYGDCGASGPQVTSGPLCLDQSENAVACADPNCTYGDCGSGTAGKSISKAGNILTAATSLPTVNRPSPVLTVPLNPSLYPSSTGLFLSGSTFGLPNWALFGFVGIAAIALLSGGGGGRRRR